MLHRIVSCISAFILTAAALGDDWPHWRGPHRDGVSRETGWSSVGAEDNIWRAHIGRGYTGSIVANGRLYTVGFHESEAEDGTGEDIVVCIDAATGYEQWRTSYPALRMDFEHEGGTLATPAFDGGDLFVMNREGVMRCLDADNGDERWLTDFRDAFGAEYQRYGFASAPVVIDDRIYVNVDRTVALDRSSGEILWQSEPLGAYYATPRPFTLRGEDRLAVFGTTGVTILDMADGTSLYHTVWRKSERNVEAATPVVIGEQIFISSAYDHGCGLYAFGENGQVETIYRNRNMRNKMAGCVLFEDHLYGFDESMLKCLNLDGEEQWRKRGFGNGSLIIADGRMIIMTSRGELIVAKAQPNEFEELSRVKVFDHGVFWSAPVLSDGLIFIRSGEGMLVCRDHRGGAATVASTEGAEQAVELPAADELFAAHLKSVGGVETVRGVESMTRRGAFEMRDVGIIPTTATLTTVAPDKWHSEWILPPALGARPVVEGFDGANGWKSARMGGWEELAPERLAELRVAPLPHDVLDIDALYPTRNTVGMVTFDERDCIQVDAATADGVARTLYFDASDGLLAGVAGEDASIWIYRDYQSFGDVHVATFMKTYEIGTGIEMTWTFDEVELGDVEEALFVNPRRAEED